MTNALKNYILMPDHFVISTYNYDLARFAASSPSCPTIVMGKTGTGKGMFAKLVHKERCKEEKRVVPIVWYSCANSNADMFESDLLGVERGAFTGATESKPGILSRAQNGILVLDELQHLTKEAQARLLVPLQNKSFRRKGSTVEQKIDFQVIALTTVNVDGKEGKEVFLPDLIGRLKGTTVYFESASDNPELVPIIVRSCFEMAEVKISDSQLEEMISLLSSQVWEKNFREVELMICSIVQQAKFASISPLSALKRILRRSTVPPSLRDDDIDRRTSGESEFQRMVREGKSLHQLFEDVEKASLIDAYRSGLKQEQICRYFNFTRSTLFRKLERYKIARELHRNTGDLPDG